MGVREIRTRLLAFRRKSRIAIATTLAAATALAFNVPAQADVWHGYWIGGNILEEYQQAGDWSYFGDATNVELDADRGGRWQPFANNLSIYWHPLVSSGHANSIGGSIRAKWGDLGWENGDLRYPTTRELATNPSRPGRFNHFEGGSIYWSQATGAHNIWGAIRDRWASMGWEMSIMGFPKGDEFVTAGNGRGQEFQNGWIYWSAGTGAKIVLAPIMNVWGANNWENGTYGYPTEDSRSVGCGQYAQRFQGGIIVTNIDAYLNSYNSVDGSEIAFQASWQDPKSATAWNSAVSEWNALGKINITQGGALGYDLTANEVNLSDEDFSGQYRNFGPLPDQIVMNTYFTDSYTDGRRKVVLTHELGHALALSHSCDTQIMGPSDATRGDFLNLQELDKAVYRYKWGF